MFVAFTKEVDKCSPKLAGYYEQKKKFPSAKLALCSPSGQQLGKFEMKEVGIMKRGKRGQGEAMTLNFEKVEFKSSPKNQGLDGTLKDSLRAERPFSQSSFLGHGLVCILHFLDYLSAIFYITALTDVVRWIFHLSFGKCCTMSHYVAS